MNIQLIDKLIKSGHIEAELKAGITLKVQDDIFQPGTFRVHLPAPVNACWLKEGQLLNSDPVFRMVSVEDYPQRSVYFNEILKENRPFSVSYAFTSEHSYLKPDIKLIDSTAQHTFTREQIKKYTAAHHCSCESYTSLPKDSVRIQDVCEEKGIAFRSEYKEMLTSIKDGCLPKTVALQGCAGTSIDNGSLTFAIYRYIIEHFNRFRRNDHNIAFTAMCRMCGIPARWQGGWACENIFLPEGKYPADKVSGHDFSMVHLLPYGWIYIDCSFGADAYEKGLSVSGTSLSDFFFGNIDPCMVPTASAPSSDLYPAKDYERADKVFNVYGEVEMIPGKFTSEGHFEGRGLKKDEYSSAIFLSVTKS